MPSQGSFKKAKPDSTAAGALPTTDALIRSPYTAASLPKNITKLSIAVREGSADQVAAILKKKKSEVGVLDKANR